MDATQFSTLVTLLGEIRDRLTYLCEPVEDVVEAPACEHPEERRTDFSRPGLEHWTCGLCGHVEQRSTTTAPASPPSASAEE
jgi:hypothetical protein